MVVRVVCGLSATIASFEPTNAFSSVDLPVLGRPRIETKPETKPVRSVMRDGLRSAQANLDYTAFIAGEDFDAQSIPLDDFALVRNMPKPLRNEAPNGGRFDVFLRTVFEHIRKARQIEIS